MHIRTRLFEQLQKHPDQVFAFGQYTAKSNPGETSEIFQSQIGMDAKSAADRKSYQAVCQRIVQYAKSGFRDAAKKLAAEYKENYKRRPAFVDELIKIERSI